MTVKWTEEQKQVIGSRGQNLLVSAAAGSGKTAVLVEHILSVITDPSCPVDVTELLVVTFTRAAAAEMKERLSEQLEERLREDPWNIHMQRQIPLLSQAHICTIDSFCSWLVRNYFQDLDIDPGFRIAEEGEDKLLREDVLSAVMDDAYEEDTDEFRHLMDAFGSGRGDRNVRDLILRLYDFADSFPWPGEWLKKIRSQCQPAGEETGWLAELEERLRKELSSCHDRLLAAARRADAAEGLAKYAEMFRSDAAGVLAVLRKEQDFLASLREISFVRRPSVAKKIPVDESERQILALLRDQIKGEIQAMAERYGSDAGKALEMVQKTGPDRRALIDLTMKFSKAFSEEKERQNLATFNDVEHWALELLVRLTDGKEQPTPLAAVLGDTFREVIVDEYQDSNRIQEMILRTLSGEDRGHPNMFMVGDVKQSIYKFRKARPEIFMEKYRRFRDEPHTGEGQRMDLSVNFRSRRQVLRPVNSLFSRIMSEQAGGVEYDQRSALYYGADIPGEDPAAELMILETDSSSEDRIREEAEMAAARIRQILDHPEENAVWDRKKGEFRDPHYRDIVILLRTMEGWAGIFADVMNQAGIPAYAQLSGGYFAAREIQVLLHFLRMLDNPLRDLSLAAVMLSPIGGFSMSEMAELTAGTPEEMPLLRRIETGAGSASPRWIHFHMMLERYRREAVIRPIRELLEMVLEETDYRLILSAMPAGKIRTANVDMLLERATQFETTSYHGIFQFLRYMDQLQKYEIDFGEAQVMSESENLVRITSIHKSKGLEYPIVFVCGCGKGFALMDARSPMLMHEDLGIACDYYDVEERIHSSTLWKKVVADRLERDVRSEELRILYVAMTRAREKLILTGAVSDWEKVCAKWTAAAGEGTKISAETVNRAGNVLDWLAMALVQNPDSVFLPGEEGDGLKSPLASCLKVSAVSGSEIRLSEESRRITDLDRRRFWEKAAWSTEAGGEFGEELKKLFSFRYPWEELCYVKPAWSVSELKHRAAEKYVRESAGEEDSGDGQGGGIIPGENTGSADMRETALWENPEGRISPGAIRGTAYHSLLEYLPAAEGTDPKKVSARLEEMVKKGLLTEEEKEMIRIPKITRFFRSYLGNIAAEAEERGCLYREKAFLMQVPVSEIGMGTYPEEWVVVQGIIDAFAETPGGELILWDYKTDSVPAEGGEDRLRGLYTEQMIRYREALEKARGQKVREIWIYSFALEKCIPINLK